MTSDSHERIRFLKSRGWKFDRQAKGAHQIWVYEPTGATMLVSTSSGSSGYLKGFRREIEKKEQGKCA